MAAGIYGTVVPANIDPEQDVELFYGYRPTRGTDGDTPYFGPLDYTCLEKTETSEGGEILGLYNIKLPLDKFNRKGFYTVYIRPKEYHLALKDVSVLAAYPDVKGIVVAMEDVDNIDDLTGYIVRYKEEASESITNTVRLITSSNRCEPVLVTVSDQYPKTTRYRLTDSSSNYLFCTVTPSTANSYKPNVTPYIGVPGGEVIISNTKFNPVMLEIEMVDHDADTITNVLEGDQVRNRDKAIITTYNDEKEIYMQQDYYIVKDKLGKPLYEVKKKRDTVDTSENYDDIMQR
jgi:hypothetical protein